jgi:transposase InsO family protein
VSLAERRRCVTYLKTEYEVSERRACQAMQMHRSSYRYVGQRRREGLQVVRKRRKKKCLGMTTQWVHRAEYPNHVWSYDFVFDQTEDGRQLKCLTVVDEFARQGLAIRLGRSLTATDVTRILDELFREHGRPVCIRSDNGPELVSKHVQKWLKDNHVDTHLLRELQLDLSNDLPGSMPVRFNDRSQGDHR